MRIDAHQHFWRYDPGEFPWLDDTMAAQRRDFLPANLAPILARRHFRCSIAVQARMNLAETDWLLQLARENPRRIRGVVGWVPLSEPARAAAELDRHLASRERNNDHGLVGVRHVVQGQPPGFLDAPDFNAGIREVTARGLAYDLLIHANQLDEAIRFVDRHPAQTFVLDHIGKPPIAPDEPPPEAWAVSICKLACRENVSCKFSALTTEVRAPGHEWTPKLLRPYFDTVLTAFGPRRLMFGSDWPVCLAGTTYERWHRFVITCTTPLSSHERASIFGETAIRAYKLPVSIMELRELKAEFQTEKNELQTLKSKIQTLKSELQTLASTPET